MLLFLGEFYFSIYSSCSYNLYFRIILVIVIITLWFEELRGFYILEKVFEDIKGSWMWSCIVRMIVYGFLGLVELCFKEGRLDDAFCCFLFYVVNVIFIEEE